MAWKKLEMNDLRLVLSEDEMDKLNELSLDESITAVIDDTIELVSNVWRGALKAKGMEIENYEKAQKKNEEKRKKLTDKRDNLLLDIEDDYTQQGVDLLTSMGKAGKYMSSMEMASLNQERFSPITKKMDDM